MVTETTGMDAGPGTANGQDDCLLHRSEHTALPSVVLSDPYCSGSLTNLDQDTAPSDGDGNLVTKQSDDVTRLAQIDDKAETGSVKGRRLCCGNEMEGRTAWLMAVVAMVITFTIASEFSSFGIYYVEYTSYFHVTKGAVGLIKGIQTLAGGVFGLIGGSFVKVYGCRTMTIIGALCSFTGMLSASFSPGIVSLYITQGVILGAGISMMNVSTAVMLQRHFTKNPVLGTGIAFMGFTLGSISSPLWVSALLDAYGIQGSLLIHSAIIAHGLPAALLFREPKQLHPVKVDTLCTQIKQELCNFSLFKNVKFLMVGCGGFCLHYAISAFVTHLPGRAVFYGWPRSEAAYLQSIVSIASMVSRISSTLVANIKCVNKIIYYCVSIWFVVLGPFTYAFLTNYSLFPISPVLFGLGMGSSTTVFFAVLVLLFGIDQLPKVVGFYTIATSLGLSLGPPISGAIFDRTGNYDVPFLLAGCVGMLGNIVYLGVWFLHRHQTRTKRDSGRSRDEKV